MKVFDYHIIADGVTDKVKKLAVRAKSVAERRHNITLSNEEVTISKTLDGHPCVCFSWIVDHGR